MKDKRDIKESVQEMTDALIKQGFDPITVEAASRQVAEQDAEAVLRLGGEGSKKLQAYREGMTLMTAVIYALGKDAGPLAVRHLHESEELRKKLLAVLPQAPVTGMA